MTQTVPPPDVAASDVTADGTAPYGLDPNGQAYKSDPGPLRGMPRRTSTRRAAKATMTPKRRPAAAKKPPAKATEAQRTHGQRIAGWFGVGAAFVERKTGPLDGQLVRMYGQAAAPLIDQIVAEDPRIGRWLDRLTFSMGAKGELAMLTLTTAGASAVAHGYSRHPMLIGLVGGVMTQAAVGAAIRQWQQEAAGVKYETDGPAGSVNLHDLRLMFGEEVTGADVARVNELVAGFLTPPEPTPAPDVTSDDPAPEGATVPA